MPAGRDPADHELGREAGRARGTTRPRQTTKGAGFMTDDELQAMVRDELFWDPKVGSEAIVVSANEGEVTL
jgi:osmotically-inducible protein OsmY